MSKVCHAIGVCMSLVCASCCLANITSMNVTAGSYAVQHNVSSSPVQVFFQSASGVPHSLLSPLTVSSPGSMNYLTQATTSGSILTSTASAFEYRSSFAGEANTYGTPNGNSTGYSEVLLGTTINFTLSAPATLQLFSTNTVSSLIPGSNQSTAQANKWMQLDGTFVHSTFTDGSYLLNVGVGSHTVDLTERVFASFVSSGADVSDSAYAFGTSRSRVLITVVPEPAGMAAVSVLSAVVGGRRRRIGQVI